MTQEERRSSRVSPVQEQSNSGLRVAEWCRQKTINEKTFRRWKRNLTTDEILKVTAPLPAGWCQIQAKPTTLKAASSLKLLVNGRVTIELQSGFDHQMLREVLSVLCP